MRRGVWLLEGSLGPTDPALRSCPEAPAVFVFDENMLQTKPTSFKRLFFVYESVVETFAERLTACEIRRGTMVQEVFDFCRKHGLEEIHVTRAPYPEYSVTVDQLRANFLVMEHDPEEMIRWDRQPPRRFMDLWREVLPRVLPDEAGD